MTGFGKRKLASVSAALIFGLALAGAPAMAEKGGNGGGNGGGNHGGGNAGGNNASHGKSASTSKSLNASTKASHKPNTGKPMAKVAMTKEKVKGSTASRFGKLNGFLHASDKALAHTAPDSAIGKVLYGYGDLLNAYLVPPVGGATAPTPAQLAAALAAAANKPLTEAAIAAVNARLLSYSPTLAENLKTSGKTAEGLLKEISGAL